MDMLTMLTLVIIAVVLLVRYETSEPVKGAHINVEGEV